MSERSQGTGPAVIEARGITHRYSGVLALDDVSISIAKGSFSAIVGPNGAGKSTLAQVLAGAIQPSAGTVSGRGRDGDVVRPGRSFVQAGICLVPEGRRLFGQLTVEENLVVAGYGVGLNRAQTRRRMEAAIEILPAALREGMGSRLAGMLSGGERQMLALARALMADPSVVLIDEPSLGLAPILIYKVYEVLTALNRRGVTVVVIEQQVTHALGAAGTLHLLARGRLTFSGPAAGAAAAAALRAGYVGAADDRAVMQEV